MAIFTKRQALATVSIILIALLIYYTAYRVFLNASGAKPGPPSIYSVEKIPSFFEGYEGLYSGAVSVPDVIPYPLPPPPATECKQSTDGKYFYPQGVVQGTTKTQCTDQCPVPTLPNNVGHCVGGLKSA